MSDLWVFGYGSLMWRPGFDFVEARIGTLDGYHRALCVYSYVHRGTVEHPGLVMGLSEGGSCQGMVFRVPHGQRGAVIDYLRAREQVTSVYLEDYVPVRLRRRPEEQEDAVVSAVTYIADTQHEQFAGKLSLEEQCQIVLGSSGQAGPNIDYVLNTVDHLEEIQIRDDDLTSLANRLRQVKG
ncbi:gamma-glutamylcyclotransferase [uncultured Cohaesibacter sp.]|uniref:gamma-glutamylcyclotransferase n=1 Tax=uncultured Cohaesibacter sp. TaxID=1002546 RepID=UPI00292E3896|nr:gamma-glutamylcyclotransferase [uncultured Cohaesibacter sp.]